VSSSRSRLMLAFAAVYLIWGSTYLAIRVVLETLPPFLTAGVRFLVAGAVLTLLARSRGTPAPTRTQWKWAFVLGALLLLMGNGAVMWAEQKIPSGPAALLVATEPILIVLLQGVFPTGALLAGLLLGFGGVVVLVGPSALGGGEAIDLVAALVVVIGCLGWASGSLLGRKVPTPTSGTLAAGIQMLAGGAILSVAGILHGDLAQLDLAHVSVRSIVALLYLIVFGSIVAFTAYGYLMRNAAPSVASTYAFVNPVVAVVLGWLILDEPLSGRIAIAAVAIVAGVVLITVQKTRQAPP
jgi:drug/metabolite transporter (DMT)-like permease